MSYRINLARVRRNAFPGIVFVLWAISGLGCQSYSTGVQKTETRTDETAVISALRTVALAQQAHAITGGGGYGTFHQLVEGGFLDSRFNSESPQIQGHVFTMKIGDKTFGCNADPTADNKGRHFYVDSSSQLIRVNETQPASASDDLLKL